MVELELGLRLTPLGLKLRERTQVGLAERIADNLAEVRQRIADAAARCDRSFDEIELVAVTKTRSIERIEALLDAGQKVLGENRVQEALPKIEALGDRPEWHLIGHLQRNKAKQAVGGFGLIHSADSERLLLALDKAGRARGKRVRALLQVNCSGEEQKAGCEPKDAKRLFDLCSGLQYVELDGLMTMAAFFDDPEKARPAFRRLRELREQLADQGIREERLAHLSMGMSGDFEQAIEEGSTMVRIGSALFR